MHSVKRVTFMTRLNFSYFKFKLFYRNKILSQTASNSELIWPIQPQQIMVEAPRFGTEDSVNEIYDVGHIDTLDFKSRNIPKEVIKNARTVLYLGNEHFLDNSEMLIKLQNNLLKPLSDNNCRVIVPFGLGSKNTNATYGTDKRIFKDQLFFDRLNFLLQFMANKRLGNMACFMALAVKTSLENVGGVALINPIPGNDAPRWIKPGRLSIWFTDRFHSFFAMPFVFPWLCLRRVVGGKELMGLKFKDREVKHFINVSHGISYESTRGMALTMDSYDTPLLYVSCRDDPAVNKKDEEEYIKLFGLDATSFDDYDEQFQVCSPSRSEARKMHGIRIPGCSHFPFGDKKSSELIVQELLKLLNYKPNEKRTHL